MLWTAGRPSGEARAGRRQSGTRRESPANERPGPPRARPRGIPGRKAACPVLARPALRPGAAGPRADVLDRPGRGRSPGRRGAPAAPTPGLPDERFLLAHPGEVLADLHLPEVLM